MNTLKGILFDLDGTLIDTAPDFVSTLNTLLARHNKPSVDADSIRQTVSHGARALVTLGFGINPEDEGFEELRLELLDIYEGCLADSTRLFPGMEEVLDHIESLKLSWGIVTNKPSLYTDKILSALNLSTRAMAAVCPDHVRHTKPHPEPMYLACDIINCHPTQALYVGDHKRDIDAGRNAGMPTVAARYGYVDKPEQIELWRADYIIEQPGDLINLINEIRNR
ncbi:MAG: HAD-IA family hydrolase [Pseudomonadales bacterium]